jgi:sensor histidine kinase YesM
MRLITTVIFLNNKKKINGELTMRRRRLRNYLIKKDIQLGLTYRFLFILILFSLFIGFQAYIIIWPVVSGFISKELMNLVRHQIFIRLLFFSLPFIVVIIGFTIVFTHRIAGPIYRFELTLDRLNQGEDVPLIKLRPGDELKELAEKINDMILLIKNSKKSSNNR